MNLIYNLFGAFLTFLLIIFAYFKWTYTYWKRKGLHFLEPSIPFGNNRDLMLNRCSISEQFANHYFRIKEKGLKHAGVFFLLKPTYIPVDPEIIKNILQRDFEHFTDRGFYYNEETDPLGANLVTLDGLKWKNLRAKLTPNFTSGKMRMMFKILADCAKEFDPVLQELCAQNKPVDIRDTLARFSTDVISSCAFGLDTSCLKDPKSEFRTYGKKHFTKGPAESLKEALTICLPHGFFRKLGLSITKTEVSNFFINIIKETIKFRKNNIRNDFLQLLLEIQDSDPSFDLNKVAAQAFIFFIAGFETSSNTMAFTLLELSLNEGIQEKLRNEIKRVLSVHNNEISYDAISEMTYLDQVVNESLRKHPPGAVLLRKCTKDYKIPETDVILEKGTLVFISVLGIHRDPQYYPKPEVFDPERFSPENKNSRSAILHLPFGQGPRNCIGLRFGFMQSKVGLVALLRNYKFTVNEKTKLPIKIDPHNVIHMPAESIWLNVAQI